jgi:glutathione S-transferase
MKLFFSNGSPYARKVRVVLAEMGLTYVADVQDRVRPIAEAPGPTLAIPLLEDGTLRLWESDLIIDYLLRTYPGAQPAARGGPSPPFSPWLARPDRHWEDMTTLATIATAAASMVNLRLMQDDGITPANSDYLSRQKTRVERCLDWLEERVTDEGFAPGWFSVMDIAFLCPMIYAETRGIMKWRGRPRLDALAERHQSRPSMVATQITYARASTPRYIVERRPSS